MKCVKDHDKVLRVSDDEAFDLVRGGNWKYVPKKEWKEKVRDSK